MTEATRVPLLSQALLVEAGDRLLGQFMTLVMPKVCRQSWTTKNQLPNDHK